MEDPDPRRFVIGPCLGSGGFGEVYRAIMSSPGGLESEVAVKVLRTDLGLEADAVGRLRDEGALLARIQHPVVVRALDLIRLDGRLALVMEWVDGADLEAIVRLADPPGPRAVLQAIANVASALAVAWDTRGPDDRPLHIVHRDIKPTNIRVGRHGDVKLLDFGIARFDGTDRSAKTATDVVLGSMPYMAPERFVQGGAAEPAADVFGLGCCLFEALALERFHPDGRLRSLSALALDPLAYDVHLHRRLEALDGASPSVIELVEQCLAFEPAARPTSVMLADGAEALADQLPGPSLRRWCRDREWADAPHPAGALEGRTLTEGALGVPEPKPAPRDPGGPRLIQRPLGTLDPAMFDDGGPLPKKDTIPVTPQAPPAFPSIPLGMAIDQLQISEQELSDALGTPPPAPERPGRPKVSKKVSKPRRPTSAPPPVVVHEPDDGGVSPLQWAMLGAGCLLLIGAVTGVTVGLIAVGIYAFTM